MGERQCHLCQSSSLGAVHCNAHFRNRTPGVQGDTGPSNFSIGLVGCPIHGTVQNRTACVRKFRLRQTGHGVVNWYESCWNRTPTAQSAMGHPMLCTACSTCTASYIGVLYRTVQLVYENSVSTRLDPMA